MAADCQTEKARETDKGVDGLTYTVDAGAGCKCKDCENKGCIIWYILHVQSVQRDYPLVPWQPYTPYVPYVPYIPFDPKPPFYPTYISDDSTGKPLPTVRYQVTATIGEDNVQC